MVGVSVLASRRIDPWGRGAAVIVFTLLLAGCGDDLDPCIDGSPTALRAYGPRLADDPSFSSDVVQAGDPLMLAMLLDESAVVVRYNLASEGGRATGGAVDVEGRTNLSLSVDTELAPGRYWIERILLHTEIVQGSASYHASDPTSPYVLGVTDGTESPFAYCLSEITPPSVTIVEDGLE